jgi:L-fucose isomerase-like protein
MTKGRKPKAGFVGFGEVNTPKDVILTRCETAAHKLEQAGLELSITAPVCDDPQGSEAARARAELAQSNFDLLIICVAGWIPSWAVLSVIEPFKHKPMVLWGLSGWRYGDRLITTADQAGTTALRKPMADMGYRFKYVVTYCGQELRIDDIVAYAKAARAATDLKTARIGMAGYRDMRLYGTLYDGVSLKAKIGPEIEHFDLLEISRLMEQCDSEEISHLASTLLRRWTFAHEPRPGTLENTVRLFLALRAKIQERGYQGLSYSDVDGIKKLMKFAPAGSLTLLHDEMDICSVPENDCLGAATQLIVRHLTGQVGAYLEFYEFTKVGALMGVPDYVPSEIVDGRVTVMPTAFGDFGEGLLNVSKLKKGRVTICRLGYSGHEYVMHIMTGTARVPPKWEEVGWAPPAPQLPSLDIVFEGGVEDFVQKVLAQHYIISYGDNRKALESLCSIQGTRIL